MGEVLTLMPGIQSNRALLLKQYNAGELIYSKQLSAKGKIRHKTENDPGLQVIIMMTMWASKKRFLIPAKPPLSPISVGGIIGIRHCLSHTFLSKTYTAMYNSRVSFLFAV